MERDFLTPLFCDLRDSRQRSAWLPLRCIAALQSFVPAQSRLPGSAARGTFGAACGGLSCAVHSSMNFFRELAAPCVFQTSRFDCRCQGKIRQRGITFSFWLLSVFPIPLHGERAGKASGSFL